MAKARGARIIWRKIWCSAYPQASLKNFKISSMRCLTKFPFGNKLLEVAEITLKDSKPESISEIR
jgi:hypothetical protein